METKNVRPFITIFYEQFKNVSEQKNSGVIENIVTRRTYDNVY